MANGDVVNEGRIRQALHEKYDGRPDRDIIMDVAVIGRIAIEHERKKRKDIEDSVTTLAKEVGRVKRSHWLIVGGFIFLAASVAIWAAVLKISLGG